MKRSSHRGVLALGLMALVGAIGPLSGRHSAHANDVPSAAGEHVGPREVSASSTARVAPSFVELQAMIADTNGPREIELLPQVYQGNLVIGRPLILRGRKGAILDGAGVSTVVTIRASDVLLENVVVRHSGSRHTVEDGGIKATGERVRIEHVRVEDTLFGISLEACTHCLLEGAHVVGRSGDLTARADGIKLWESHDSTVRGSVLEWSRDMVVWYSRRTLIENNVVRHARYGSHFMYAHDAVVRGGEYRDNVVGIFVMYSRQLTLENNVLAGARGAAGLGLGFKDSDALVIRHNSIVANTAGLYFDNTPRTLADPVFCDGNMVALNDVGIRLHGIEKGVTLSGNDFHQNVVLIEQDGGGQALGLDAHENHYSDYEGYDLDGDGVGDVAYEVKALSSELTQHHPTLAFFNGTAAMGMIDGIARAVPMFASRKIFVDPKPRMEAARVPRP